MPADAGKAKDDHFTAMIARAAARGFRPRTVLLDGRHPSLANLKRACDSGWTFLTQLGPDRSVGLGHAGHRAASRLTIGDGGVVVHQGG